MLAFHAIVWYYLLARLKSRVLESEKGWSAAGYYRHEHLKHIRITEGRKTAMDLVKALSDQYLKPELPAMNVGDTVRVTVRVKEGNRERNQAFEGTIIAKKHGGINETITVRRISYNVGCEKVFPVHSPSIVSVETVRRGKVRRAKLYYLRDRVGKKAKVKERI